MPCRTSLGRSASCEVSPPICWNTLGTNANDASFACSANSSIRRSPWPSFTLRNQSASRGTILRGNTRLCPQHPLLNHFALTWLISSLHRSAELLHLETVLLDIS